MNNEKTTLQVEIPNDLLNKLNELLETRKISLSDYLAEKLNKESKRKYNCKHDPEHVHTFANIYLTESNPRDVISLPSLYEAYLGYSYDTLSEPTPRKRFTYLLQARGFKRSTRPIGNRPTVVLLGVALTPQATTDKIIQIYERHEAQRAKQPRKQQPPVPMAHPDDEEQQNYRLLRSAYKANQVSEAEWEELLNDKEKMRIFLKEHKTQIQDNEFD
ncbi:MAG: hypothetical protein DDT23_01063 [candidate division WS2 bacterium]|nr:hypothetical protein [Candidatus Lithacetigena glycinireducens]